MPVLPYRIVCEAAVILSIEVITALVEPPPPPAIIVELITFPFSPSINSLPLNKKRVLCSGT